MSRLIILLALLGMVGCSDDSSPSGPSPNNSTNNSTNNPTNNSGSNNTNQTNQNTSNNPEDMGVTEDMAADMPEPDMAEDMEPDLPAIEDFPCFHPSSETGCPEGEFGGGAMFTAMELPEDNSCCFDFNSDGATDNRLGTLLGIATSLGFDVNEGLAEALQFGDVIYVLEFANLANTTRDSEFDLTFYTGRDTDIDFEPNFAGNGSVYLRGDAFNSEMPIDPKWQFSEASLSEGVIEASGGTMLLEFPGLLEEVRIQAISVRLEANLSSDSDLAAGGRVTLSQGKLGGIILRDDFYGSLNDASKACECLNREVYDRRASGTYACNSTLADESACQTALPGCRFLASSQYCGVLGTLSGNVDIDTDGDGDNDGYSFGATFETVGTKIEGIEPF
jgi:hypothetical protein